MTRAQAIEQLAQSVRLGSFTLRTECRACGNPVPVNEPRREVHCDRCQQDMTLPAALFSQALDRCEEWFPQLGQGQRQTGALEVEGFTLRYEIGREAPRCEKCGGEYPVDALAPDCPAAFACVACGDPASTAPAPDWLRAVVPTAVQWYSTGAGAVGADLRGAAVQPSEAAAHPVVMACPQCASPLRVTADVQRLTPCQACGADIYLPDAIWLRLHPARTVSTWYVAFQGMNRWLARALGEELTAKRNAATAARRQQVEEQDRARRREQEAADLRRKAEALPALGVRVRQRTGLLLLVMAGGTAWGLAGLLHLTGALALWIRIAAGVLCVALTSWAWGLWEANDPYVDLYNQAQEVFGERWSREILFEREHDPLFLQARATASMYELAVYVGWPTVLISAVAAALV